MAQSSIYKLSNVGGMNSINHYLNMLAGNTVFNPWSPTGAFDALGTVTLSTSTPTVTFSGIPAEYKHLQIRYAVRTDMNSGGNWSPVNIRFNADSGSTYSVHSFYGTGSSAAAEGYASQTSANPGFGAPNTFGANVFGVGIVDVLDYSSTSKNKTIRSFSGTENNGSGIIMFQSGGWFSTAAINSLTFGLYGSTNGSNYLANTTFALYGIK